MTQHGNPDLPSNVDSKAAETCHSCEKENPAGSRYCEHCGAELRATTQTARKRSRGKQLSRRRANKEIASIANLLKSLRGLFIFLACVYGVLFLLLVAGASAIGVESEDHAAMVWGLLAVGSVFLFSLLGAVFLYRNPLAWSLTLSCLISLDVAYAFMSGSFPIFGCLIALICWSVTIRVASIKTLLTEFADTVAAQKLTGTRERVDGGEMTTRSQLRMARSRSRGAPKTVAFIVGGVLVFGLLIILATQSSNRESKPRTSGNSAEEQASRAKAQLKRERSYELVIEAFVRSWKRSDHGEIATFIPDGDWRTLAMKKLDRSLERYGFSRDKLPSIDDRRDLWARNTPVVKTYFRIPAMQGERQAKLRTRWEQIDSMWKLTEIGLRKTKRE